MLLPRANDGELAARTALAAQVRDTLAEAGLPTTGDLSPGLRVGATVFVDPADDPDGGVWVCWCPAPSLDLALLRCVEEKRFDDPVFERVSDVNEAMKHAILVGAGYQAVDPQYEYNTHALRVHSGPATPR